MPSKDRPELRVQPQGRVYVAIIGVVVGMLVAGLGVPLTFGRVSGSEGTQQDGLSSETFNTATGSSYAAGNESTGLRAFCGMIKEFAAGARAAGPNLTRPAFARAVQGLGSLSLPAVLRGSFGPGKTDFNDWQRPMTWSLSCRCYRNAGPAQRNRY